MRERTPEGGTWYAADVGAFHRWRQVDRARLG